MKNEEVFVQISLLNECFPSSGENLVPKPAREGEATAGGGTGEAADGRCGRLQAAPPLVRSAAAPPAALLPAPPGGGAAAPPHGSAEAPHGAPHGSRPTAPAPAVPQRRRRRRHSAVRPLVGDNNYRPISILPRKTKLLKK